MRFQPIVIAAVAALANPTLASPAKPMAHSDIEIHFLEDDGRSIDNLLPSIAKRSPDDIASGAPPLVPDAQYSTDCTSTDTMVYFYTWWEVMSAFCDKFNDRLDFGIRELSGIWSENLPGAGEAKEVRIHWSSRGDKCDHSCRQVFTRLFTAGGCRGLNFWMKQTAKLTYDGCGEVTYRYNLPAPAHVQRGTGLCWTDSKSAPYKPDDHVVEEFCDNALQYITKDGSGFTKNKNDIPGYYWTSYGERTADISDYNQTYDVGFVHFWIRPQWDNKDACPSEKQDVDAMIAEFSIDQCKEWYRKMHALPCGAPTGLSTGGRLYGDCFEWGSKGHGYYGLAAPAH
ncbi:hypothetical protein C8034_v009001 [Colletotrichum sidae]|uniref:Uncharacterized protein n=1 Tax=Colletotrichum sidae TaxID=1347389 RepID=A0A4R8TPD4_9PEZI|nr:hypothetical protein C8034_v009001 [Colletotrichum sidae]